MSETKDITQNNPGVVMNKVLVKRLKSLAVQPKFTKHRDWEPNANVKEISIGDPDPFFKRFQWIRITNADPVKSFKEWSKMNFNKITG